MIMIGLAIIAFVFIIALIIGAIYWILWILTAIFVILAIVSHLKYLEWKKAVPSSTKCPECGASMLVKTVNAGTSGIAAGTMLTSSFGLGTSNTQNHYGQLMVCKVCGHQEYRLTRQTIDAMTQKYKGRRNLFAVLFVLSLIGAVAFTQMISGDSAPSTNVASSANSEQVENTTNVDLDSAKEEMKSFSLYDGLLTAELPAKWNYDKSTDSILRAIPSGDFGDRETFAASYEAFDSNYTDVDIEEQLTTAGHKVEENNGGVSTEIKDLKQELVENDEFGVVLKQTYVNDYKPAGYDIVIQHEAFYCPVNNEGLFGVLILDHGYDADKESKYEKEFHEVFIPGIKINGIKRPVEEEIVESDNEETATAEGNHTSAEEKLTEALGEELSARVKSILSDEIGFTEIKFIERQGDNDNYSFTCDGHSIIVTAFSDEEGEFMRIFEPHTGNVVYEDGQLLMTKDDMESKNEETNTDDNTIYAEDTVTYQIIAEEIISSRMKDPSSAKFPSAVSDDWSYGKKGDLIAVQSYVDGINSFGASVRSKFIVEFYITDRDTFSYEIQYIRIGNDEQGEFIDIS